MLPESILTIFRALKTDLHLWRCYIISPGSVGKLWLLFRVLASNQIRSVAQSCPTLCDPMNHSTPGLPVHHQLPEFTETHVHRNIKNNLRISAKKKKRISAYYRKFIAGYRNVSLPEANLYSSALKNFKCWVLKTLNALKPPSEKSSHS